MHKHTMRGNSCHQRSTKQTYFQRNKLSRIIQVHNDLPKSSNFCIKQIGHLIGQIPIITEVEDCNPSACAETFHLEITAAKIHTSPLTPHLHIKLQEPHTANRAGLINEPPKQIDKNGDHRVLGKTDKVQPVHRCCAPQKISGRLGIRCPN